MDDLHRHIIDAIRRTKVPTVQNLARKLDLNSTRELRLHLQKLESIGMVTASSNQYFLTQKCRELLLV